MIKNYRKKALQPMQPWVSGMNMDGVSISDEDKANGSPKAGDMIAHNPENEADRWLVARAFCEQNYEVAE